MWPTFYITPVCPALVNLGAEARNTSGWTITAGNPQARYAQANREPPEGLGIFDGGTSAFSEMYQRLYLCAYPAVSLDDIDAGTVTITVDWWGGTYEQTTNDQPRMTLVFRDSALSVISSFTNGYRNPSTVYGMMKWDEYVESTTVPSGTRFIDLVLAMNRRAGTNNDAAFDDIRVSFA